MVVFFLQNVRRQIYHAWHIHHRICRINKVCFLKTKMSVFHGYVITFHSYQLGCKVPLLSFFFSQNLLDSLHKNLTMIHRHQKESKNEQATFNHDRQFRCNLFAFLFSRFQFYVQLLVKRPHALFRIVCTDFLSANIQFQ